MPLGATALVVHQENDPRCLEFQVPCRSDCCLPRFDWWIREQNSTELIHLPQYPESELGDWGFGGAICVDGLFLRVIWFGTPRK